MSSVPRIFSKWAVLTVTLIMVAIWSTGCSDTKPSEPGAPSACGGIRFWVWG